jgi:hypothetical protein
LRQIFSDYLNREWTRMNANVGRDGSPSCPILKQNIPHGSADALVGVDFEVLFSLAETQRSPRRLDLQGQNQHPREKVGV